MKELTMSEIEQVNGAGLLSLMNVVAGAIVGGGVASQIGAVNFVLSGIVIPAGAVGLAGVVLGASFGLAVARLAETPSQYYHHY